MQSLSNQAFSALAPPAARRGRARRGQDRAAPCCAAAVCGAQSAFARPFLCLNSAQPFGLRYRRLSGLGVAVHGSIPHHERLMPTTNGLRHPTTNGWYFTTTCCAAGGLRRTLGACGACPEPEFGATVRPEVSKAERFGGRRSWFDTSPRTAGTSPRMACSRVTDGLRQSGLGTPLSSCHGRLPQHSAPCGALIGTGTMRCVGRLH